MTFAYHRAVTPMLWAFVAIAGIELIVDHLLVALWKPKKKWDGFVLAVVA